MISFQSLKLLAASSLLAISVSLPSHAGVHVNVNVGIGTPGYYGVLPIQGVTPSLWNANPIVAIGAALAGAPIYLTVPDNHRRHWRRYCAEYGACGVPVYFVNAAGTTSITVMPLLHRRLLPRQDNMLVQNMTEALAGTIVLRLAVRMPVPGPRKVMIGTTIAAPDVKEDITKTIKIELSAAKKGSGRFGGSDLLGLF